MANVPISAFTVPANTVGIGATGYSLTGSASASFMDLAGTWNTSGTPTAIKLNITDTASNAASLLMDLQTTVSGVTTSKFRVRKDGLVTFTGNDVYFTGASGACALQILVNSSQIVMGAGQDLYLCRRGAANFRFGTSDAAAPVAQTLSVQSVVAGTTNTAGTNFTITGSQGTGTGAGGSLIFQVAPAGTAGSVQNALQNVFLLPGVAGEARLVNAVGGGVNLTIATTANNNSTIAFRHSTDTVGVGGSIAGHVGRISSVFGLFDGGSSAILTGTASLVTVAGSLTVSGTSTTPAVAVAVSSLPSPTTGMIARVNNALAPAVGATVAGGGAAQALVWYNGANWTVIGV